MFILVSINEVLSPPFNAEVTMVFALNALLIAEAIVEAEDPGLYNTCIPVLLAIVIALEAAKPLVDVM